MGVLNNNYHARQAEKHETEANRLIDEALSWSEETHNILKDSVVVATAQVHATLALSHRTAAMKED